MTGKAVVKYNVTDAMIAEMESIYMDLAISDLTDKEQFDAVHSARMVVKGKRVEVEKTRKELKADALEWGRRVDAEAKRIVGKLEPIESHLAAEEKKVTDEEKRIKAEEDRREREKIDARISELAKYDIHLPFQEIAAMTDEQYSAFLPEAKKAWSHRKAKEAEEEVARKAENERLAKIAEEQRLEAERLEKIRKDQEAAQAEAQRKIDEANAKIEDEKKALEDAKRAEQERKDREAFEKQAAENARIKAEQDAKEKAEREARIALERAAAEIRMEEERKAEAERQEALRPDKEKLMAFAQFLQEGMEYPKMAGDESEAILKRARTQIYDIGEEIITAIEEL